ncbi:MAG TPA: hypothetical protein VK459_11720 [Polyangiaceae bacterium]|nr:hypothetical protein [Polyangiaceae bacterium]
MRHRLAAFILALLAVLMLGGWLIKRRNDRIEREHGAALARASREPGVLIPDPALSTGVIEIELIPAGPSIELSRPATIRFGHQTRRWSAGGRARFEEMPGKRNQRVSVVGEYLAELAALDVPPSGPGARIALRAIPIDLPAIGPPFERQLEISITDPKDIIVWWKQSNIVVAELKVPRAGPRDALAAVIQKEWMSSGAHRDPSDRRFDRAIIRFEPGALFQEIFPLVDAILATKRTITVGGETRSVPAFHVSVQPTLPSRSPHPDFDLGKPRPPTF